MSGWYPHVARAPHHAPHAALRVERAQPAAHPQAARLLRVVGRRKNDLVPGQGDFAPYCDVKFEPTDDDFRRWGCTSREGTHGGDLAWRGHPEGDNFFSFFKGRLERGDEPCYCDRDWANVLRRPSTSCASTAAASPLCIYLPLTYPHPPYCVEEPWYGITDRAALPPRIPAPVDETGKPSLLGGIRRGQRLQGWSERSAGPSCVPPTTGCARVSITSSACSATPCASANAMTTRRSSCSPTTGTSPAITGWWRRPRIRSRTV